MLIDTARLLLRRWPFVLLALVLTLGAGAAAAVLAPWSYESRGQVLFLPPTTQPGVEGRVNPFLALGPALQVTADIVRLDISDDTARAQLVAQGTIEEYEITPYLAENGGPILNITAEGPDAAQTELTVSLVSQRIIGDLRSIQDQAQAPAGSYITASVLTRTPEPERSFKDKVRWASVVAAGVLVLLLSLIVVADRAVSARRTRREGRHTGPGVAAPWVDDDDDEIDLSGPYPHPVGADQAPNDDPAVDALTGADPSDDDLLTEGVPASRGSSASPWSRASSGRSR